MASSQAAFAVGLKLGDILVTEPGTASVSVVDATTGVKTTISQGGLLSPLHKGVGVALALDGSVIVAVRDRGLIRVNPVDGAQSVLSEGGLFKDPWAIVIDRNTGAIYVADSGYDFDRPTINGPGKIIKVDPVTGTQQLIASGSSCNVFPPANMPCLNTTTAGSYLAHPYGIAIDYTGVPGTLVVADTSSFNGKGAIFRVQPVANGAQTLLWGPSSAVPAPVVNQKAPLGCPMGVAVEPTGNILTTVFTYPVPPAPVIPSPPGSYYGCTPPGIYRIDLAAHQQSVVSANAPAWQSGHAYAVDDMIFDGTGSVHTVVTAGVSQGVAPNWNATLAGSTFDGSVVWKNAGAGANWQIPFGIDIEPTANPSIHNIIVGDEGYSMLFRLSTAGAFLPASGALAANLPYVTSVSLVDFTPTGGFNAEPVRSNAQPVGVLLAGTAQTTISLTTDVNATCRYSVTSNTAYPSMASTFATTGSTAHSTLVSGLTSGSSYVFYVRCISATGFVNATDFPISFSVGSSSPASSSFIGTENPLSENGMWDSPGAWADLVKDNGAFAIGLNAQARMVTPPISANQFSEITYSQDPGSLGWVGVTTRTQSAVNGSGYLAIAYAGEVRLFRTDDTGALNFTQLASVPVDISVAPRRLRLDSQGNTHRVYFNGVQVINHTATGTLYTIGQPGFAASVFGGPQVKILSFQSGDTTNPDSAAPYRSNGLPSGVLAVGTTQATLSLSTGENATCRYATSAGVAYGSMVNTFGTTGGTSHSTLLTGLTNGSSYTYYVRCRDASNNTNTDDYSISFSVASSFITSTFSGVESPLSENGTWNMSGSWGGLQKNSGAFASGLNAAAILASVTTSDNQYSEITYSEDPGASSWVGVTTRMQGPANGSGYLAIVYAGEVRLYRADDAGGLNFTQLASAVAGVGSAPRRLRLESQGNVHRVYLNGILLITHNASGTIYTSGRPGIAASVFGGPQVKIVTFEGGNLITP